MKRIFIACAIMLSFAALGQQTETAKPSGYNYIIKVSPFAFFQSTFQVGVEKQFNSPSALVLMPSITYNQHDNGVGIELQYKNYITDQIDVNKSSYRKFYVGCYARYKNYDYSGEKGSNAEGAGILAGVNMVFSKRFHFDLYLGGGIRTSDGVSTDIFNVAYKGIAPRIGIDLGVNY